MEEFTLRKPLILKGVRQVGKTWILKEFGRRCYESTAYFNFDENEEYKQFFETTKDVDGSVQKREGCFFLWPDSNCSRTNFNVLSNIQ